MYNRINEYIEFLFRNAPQNEDVLELKEEISKDVNIKYNNYINDGLNEDMAFSQAISNIGNINELIEEIKKNNSDNVDEDNNSTKQNKFNYKNNDNFNSIDYGYKNFEKILIWVPLLQAFAISLFILSIVPVILIQNDNVAPAIMFLIIAVGVGILIFTDSIKKSCKKYHNNIVDDFKSYRNNNKKLNLFNTIKSLIWSLVFCVYFLISVFTGRWDVTWIIFIISYVIESLVKLWLLDK